MGAEPSPAFQFYPKDYLVDTAHMTHEEKGVYVDALCHAWIDEGLPNDTSRLQRIFKLSSHKMKKVWPTVVEKFFVRGSRLVNGRMEREREKQAENRRKKAESGRKGAAARWGDENGKRYGDATDSPLAKNGSSSSTATALDIENKEISISRPSTSSGDDAW